MENKYKQYRNLLKTLIEKQKNNFYREQISNNNNNMKRMYKILKDATNDKTTKHENIRVPSEDGFEFNNDYEMST